jgi:hypothetical protein
LKDLKWIFLSNSEVSRNFLGGYDAGFPKNSKLSMNYNFEKKIGGGLLCTRGAAGIWAIHIFSSTYFDEISIFELNKDHAFRI